MGGLGYLPYVYTQNGSECANFIIKHAKPKQEGHVHAFANRPLTTASKINVWHHMLALKVNYKKIYMHIDIYIYREICVLKDKNNLVGTRADIIIIIKKNI